jgi:hypothetical protein
MGCGQSAANDVVQNAPGAVPSQQSGLESNNATSSAGSGDNAKPKPKRNDPSVIPPRKMGWMSKEGHVVKNWKRRYFVLAHGIVTYYVEPSSAEPYGINEKGRISLHEYVLIQGFTGKEERNIMLSHKEVITKDLLLVCETIEDRIAWEKAFSEHIEYAVLEHKSRKQFITI